MAPRGPTPIWRSAQDRSSRVWSQMKCDLDAYKAPALVSKLDTLETKLVPFEASKAEGFGSGHLHWRVSQNQLIAIASVFLIS